MLGAPDGHVPHPRRHLHPRLRLLRRGQGDAAAASTRTSRTASPRRSASLGLRYAVVTSVTRDDLPDGGAAHFAARHPGHPRRQPRRRGSRRSSPISAATRRPSETVLDAAARRPQPQPGDDGVPLSGHPPSPGELPPLARRPGRGARRGAP
ncbi:MAG: hypothetical protein MZU79_04215 [Anaerotruncus sp.]|nr:hypothetical protein [Anaerotruncus sp.]